MRADAARMKRSAIFKGEEFERFDGEGESFLNTQRFKSQE
jgi:hypothetical protein